MSDYEKHIDKIRKYFEEHKAECYPFENELLREKDEYVKSLYFRMLCTLIRYTEEPNDMQVLYIRRLIIGSNAENELKDYMRMALELEKEDIDEFISVFKEDDLKYYFCIDSIILLSVTDVNEKNYALLAELVEILGVSKQELKYLATVAKATITQSSELFDESKEFISDTTENLSMYLYVSGFYSGAIISTPSQIHVYSKDKVHVKLSNYPSFAESKVTIENITDNLDADIVFSGCEEVVIKNCKFEGNEHHFCFYNVGRIVIENCNISDFNNRCIILESCGELTVSNNRFINCGYAVDSWRTCRGGVINSNALNRILLENNILQNCYIMNTHQNRCTGIFLYNHGRGFTQICVVGNKFIGCQCINNDDWTESYISNFGGEVVHRDNVCVGSVTKIVEDE